MVVKAEQQRIKALLKDTITLLCKNGLAFKKGFSIDALIGVTLDDDNVLLVSINETVKSDIVPEPPSPDDGGGSEEEESYHAKPSPANRGASPSRKRARIIPKREPPDPDDDGGVWDQGGPPLLSLDSTLDDSSFQSSEPNHSMPPSRRPIKQSQDSDSEDNDGNDVIVIKEELDREDWSMSSCSQQTGPGRPFGGGGGGDMGDQGDRDLAAVLQSGSLVPMGMQQQGQGGGMAWPANRSSTMTSDGSPGAAGDGTQASSRTFHMDLTRPGTVFSSPLVSSPTTSTISQNTPPKGDIKPNLLPEGAIKPGVGILIPAPRIPNLAIPGLSQFTPRLGELPTEDSLTSLTCPICAKHFTTREGYTCHLDRHRGNYRYKCSYCGKGFSSTPGLRGHLAKHTGVKEFVCPICKQEFAFMNMFREHMRKAHSQLV